MLLSLLLFKHSAKSLNAQEKRLATSLVRVRGNGVILTPITVVFEQ